MVAGRLGDPQRIRTVLGEGMVDAVALGRPLLADPDLPRKLLHEKDEEVLLCGHCLQACLARVKSGHGIGCNINPELGHELEKSTPTTQSKRIVVVGGGPAGMQAALTAHRRGHRVILFEKGRLGGQFALASIPPSKKRLEKSLRSLVAQVQRSITDLRLGDEASIDKLKALDPSVVILATGSSPIVPEIPGLVDPITAEDVLSGNRETGNKVLILGGGMIGMEIAEFLANQGKQCVIVEILDNVAKDMDPLNRNLMIKRLASLPTEIHTQTELVRMENERAIVEHQNKLFKLGNFDCVVTAVGNRKFDRLSKGLRECGIFVITVGDAEKPGRVYDAITSGHRAVLTI
jgi:pyruvate/2-oxoglutarate dehydrogenase complex dihydrolipoamide dehydrogenase (E3) component